MYSIRDKIISVRISSTLYEKFLKLTKEKTTIYNYGNKNHHRYRGKTLKDRKYNSSIDKYSIADVLEEALEMLLEKNDNGSN